MFDDQPLRNKILELSCDPTDELAPILQEMLGWLHLLERTQDGLVAAVRQIDTDQRATAYALKILDDEVKLWSRPTTKS